VVVHVQHQAMPQVVVAALVLVQVVGVVVALHTVVVLQLLVVGVVVLVVRLTCGYTTYNQ
jgi:hypothetical protein